MLSLKREALRANASTEQGLKARESVQLVHNLKRPLDYKYLTPVERLRLLRQNTLQLWRCHLKIRIFVALLFLVSCKPRSFNDSADTKDISTNEYGIQTLYWMDNDTLHRGVCNGTPNRKNCPSLANIPTRQYLKRLKEDKDQKKVLQSELDKATKKIEALTSLRQERGADFFTAIDGEAQLDDALAARNQLQADIKDITPRIAAFENVVTKLKNKDVVYPLDSKSNDFFLLRKAIHEWYNWLQSETYKTYVPLTYAFNLGDYVEVVLDNDWRTSTSNLPKRFVAPNTLEEKASGTRCIYKTDVDLSAYQDVQFTPKIVLPPKSSKNVTNYQFSANKISATLHLQAKVEHGAKTFPVEIQMQCDNSVGLHTGNIYPFLMDLEPMIWGVEDYGPLQ